ncbi:MAG: hypothetical protein KF768_13580 [Phycisphaeraceae bacterium]|nr:hypothetical protein [Phycisphaeraceae bacterium]
MSSTKSKSKRKPGRVSSAPAAVKKRYEEYAAKNAALARARKREYPPPLLWRDTSLAEILNKLFGLRF